MKTAVILMNLGTPTEPNTPAIRHFLKHFLSDRRVVEVPRLLWNVILYGVILPFRAPRLVKSYQQIWEDGGSPLRCITQKQTKKLQHLLTNKWGEKAPIVRYAMTYCGPQLSDVVDQLEKDGVEHITVLPLYPQYSATTTGSIYDQVTNIVSRRRNIPQIHIIKHYYSDILYIEALAKSVSDHWSEYKQADQLLISFHGLPQKNVDAGDPYYIQCKQTAQLLAQELQLNDSQWKMSFQSRLGYAKWLSPYTSSVLKEWGDKKVQAVDVICPAFSSDCLETLEEIKCENREIFLSAGGGQYHLITCLNDQSLHIEMMAAVVERYLPNLTS